MGIFFESFFLTWQEFFGDSNKKVGMGTVFWRHSRNIPLHFLKKCNTVSDCHHTSVEMIID